MKTYQKTQLLDLRPGRKKARFNGRKRKPQELCNPRMCVLRIKQPGHLNVRAVLHHCVPNKGLHPLRRYAAILADLVSRNGFANRSR